MKGLKVASLCLICAFTMGLFVGCGGGGDTTSSSEPQEPPKTDVIEPLPLDKIYSVLFIGNSYTKRYDMSTKIFMPMAQAEGYAITVKAIVNGGHTLEEFAKPTDEFGYKVDKELSEENYGKYDFVILQEQSLRPITERAKFYDAVRNLAERIRAIGAEPILYSTWGRKTGSSDLASLGMTNETMTWHMAASYSAIGEELDIPVAFVGLAFYDIYTNTEIEIYDDDLYHPVYTGSYLAAATLFAKIFNVDPTNTDYVGDLSDSTAGTLREAAKRAVFETPEIPEEYVRSSVGVTAKK